MFNINGLGAQDYCETRKRKLFNGLFIERLQISKIWVFQRVINFKFMVFDA